MTGEVMAAVKDWASIAGGFGSLISAGALVYSYLGRKWARQAAHQTRREEWSDGTMHTVDVSELASNAVTNSAEAKHQIKLSTQVIRQDLTDMWNDPTIHREHGRRRLPTDAIRTINRPGESTYE